MSTTAAPRNRTGRRAARLLAAGLLTLVVVGSASGALAAPIEPPDLPIIPELPDGDLPPPPIDLPDDPGPLDPGGPDDFAIPEDDGCPEHVAVCDELDGPQGDPTDPGQPTGDPQQPGGQQPGATPADVDAPVSARPTFTG